VNELKAKKQRLVFSLAVDFACLSLVSFCVLGFSVISAHQTPSQPSSISDAIPNKSSLFNKSQLGAAPTVPNPPKVVNHGKPNLAPKPPPQLKLLGNNGNEGNNDNNLNGDSNRKIVARHQSMKSPRYLSAFPSIVWCFNILTAFVCHVSDHRRCCRRRHQSIPTITLARFE
jgi:hypothetical protein